jgi:protein ImuB
MQVVAQLAVAPTPLAALWLARAGDGAICTDPAALHAALRALPLFALQLSPPLARRVEGFGLRRLGAVLACRAPAWGAGWARPSCSIWHRALGELPDPQPGFVFPEASHRNWNCRHRWSRPRCCCLPRAA